MSRTGTLSVKTQDILPIIKKWLYSEHDIFLRELVSNASDAIVKRRLLAQSLNQEIPEGQIRIQVSKTQKTIQIIDNGLGMTEEEVQKYITQLAFSGAQEFVEKMKTESGNKQSPEDIIGKFGLGFYSAFMVADKVTVDTLSYQEGAKAVQWISEGETEYRFEDSERQEVGTTITLHLNTESEKFLEEYTVKGTLTKYCSFIPHPIFLKDLDKKVEASQKKSEEQTEETQEAASNETELETVVETPVNEQVPLWKKDPSTLKDEDYLEFYRKHFPMDQDPLFWIHLKVDHPFELLGVLFFPKLNFNKPVQERSIHLYARQVFVSDNVKDIIPEFLGLLKGHIDSPDIPLNVSRSSLQGDPNVSKISNYIIKKVAESLKKLFKNDRKKYEAIWKDIGLFVKYGCLSDSKFDEQMREFVLFQNGDQSLLTFQEYQEKIPESYKEKLKEKVLYYEAGKADPALLRQLTQEHVPFVETDLYIDPHFMQHVEMKQNKDQPKIKFCSVDSEVEHLVETETVTDEGMKIKDLFQEVLLKVKNQSTPTEKTDSEEDKEEPANPTPDFMKSLDIEVRPVKNSSSPAYFKIDEQMKRFHHMSKTMGQGMGEFPLKKTLVINPNSPLVKNALKLWQCDSDHQKKMLAEKICFHVQDLATISSVGFKNNEEKDQFILRSQDLIQELSQFAIL
jgi:molecular chaperone HtpG